MSETTDKAAVVRWQCPACGHLMTEEQSKGYRQCPTGLHPVPHKRVKDFAVRFYGKPDCQEFHYVFSASSAAKARAGAKTIAAEKDWRLVELFPVPDEQRFASWYTNHLSVTI